MKIFLLYATAGFGHKKAAESLFEEFQRRRDVGFNVFLYDVLNYSIAPFRKTYPFFYYLLVRYAPWIWGLFYESTDQRLWSGAVSFLRRLVNSWAGAPLERFLIEQDPSVIVSTHFYAAEVVARLKRKGKIHSRVCTAITDFSVHRFWMNRGTDLYLVMDESTKRELLARGVPDGKIRVTGIPVSFKFGEKKSGEEMRRSIGLEPDRLTVLMTSGSFGMGPIRAILKKLEDLEQQIQVILVCGNNRRLFRRVKQWVTPLRFQCLGFVKNMHELMQASDVCLSRPSGLTTSESLAIGIPLIIYDHIPGQEARNGRFLRDRGACWEAGNPDAVGDLIHYLVKNRGEIAKVKKRVSSLARPDAAISIVDLVLAR